MRIGILSDTAENRSTGPGNIMYNLIQELSSLDHDNEITLIHTSNSSGGIYRDHDDIRVSSNPLKAALQLRTHHYNFDVLHFNSLSTKEIYTFPIMLDTANVATQYGDAHFAEKSVWPHSTLKWFRKRWTQRLASPLFEKIMPLSESAKKNFIDGGIPEGKLRVVYPAVDALYRELEPIDYGDRGGYLFHVSNRTIRKNAVNFLKSYQKLIRDGYEYPLKIAGSGWTSEFVTDIVDEKTWDYIELLGRIPPEEVLKYHARAEVYLAPTRHEGFGLTALEAMMCGTPVISHNVYAVPEVVGDAGILVDDPADVIGFSEAMKQVLDDDDLWERLSEKCRSRAEIFSWEKSAKQVLEIYDLVEVENE